MKCINCGTDNKLKDRVANQGKCLRCGHQFAFEPTSPTSVKITDTLFALAIADISVNNTLFFTPKQFFYFLDNRLRSKKISGFINGIIAAAIALFVTIWSSTWVVELIIIAIFINIFFSESKSKTNNYKNRISAAKNFRLFGVSLTIGGILLSLIENSYSIFAVSVIAGLLSFYLGNTQLSKTKIAQDSILPTTNFDSWLKRWQEINGTIIKILTPPREENTAAAINPDVTAYSFDRLVVCDSAVIAQFLIANNFHFENNCAILSVTGYPQSIFSTTMQMLRRNPELKVYALHDCCSKGIGLAHYLSTTTDWFSGSNAVIIDVGLTPRQILASKRGFFIQSNSTSAQDVQQLAPEVRQSLTADELKWLEAGNFVELESFSPQRLIKILQQGIAGTRDLGSDDSGMILIDDTSNSDLYVVESFG